MYTANPYNIYKQNSVNMASSQQLLLMLLDGAVKYTKIAKMAILNKDIQRAHKELVRVQDIFLELMITMDKNTKYMEDLYNIYDFAISEQHMSFESCENMDFIAYLNYLDYLFNRKAGKEVEHEC